MISTCRVALSWLEAGLVRLRCGSSPGLVPEEDGYGLEMVLNFSIRRYAKDGFIPLL